MSLMKKSKAEQVSFFVFLLVGIVLLLSALVNKPIREGDAHEYVLMQESLYRHASVELRLGDLNALDRIAQKWDSFNLDGITELLKKDIQDNKYLSFWYICSDSGEYYSVHFFLYSLLSVPVRILLSIVGANPLLSFQITNALFVFLAIFYIYQMSAFDIYEKYWIAALYLLSGTTYYLFWIHPEVFTASMFLIALLSVLDKRYVLSAFCAAAASMQNPPVVFFIPFIVVMYVSDVGLGNLLSIHSGISKQLKKLIWIFFAGGLSLLPSFFYWFFLGHPNPIISVGAADYRNVSLSRFFSLWFDLNQGVILGDAGLYIGIILTLFIIVLQKKKKNTEKEYFIPFLYFCATIIVAIPCLTTGNWNPGSSTFLRYGYWLVMMPMVGFLLLTRNLGSSVRWRLMVLVIVIQVGVVFANKITGNGVPFIRFTGISKSVMYHFPQWYNPVPEIFAERSYGGEHRLDKNRLYLFEKKDKITKLLLNSDKDVSGGIKDSVAEYIPISKVSRVDAGDGWYYLNGNFIKKRLVMLEPDIAYGFDNNLIEWIHWSAAEPGWRWSEGHRSTIQFPVSDQTARRAKKVQILLGPLHGSRQRISIPVNNAERFSGEIDKETVISVPLLKNDLLVDKINDLQFDLPDARVLNGGADKRVLGVYIKWLKIIASE